MFTSVLLSVAALAYRVSAQAPASSAESTVPTGRPISGDYTGALRPQVHYSPPVNFMVS